MHPSIKILLFVICIFLINVMPQQALMIAAMIGVLGALRFAFSAFVMLISRMTVFLLSIILIYAFLTPGEYIPLKGFLDQSMITYEGLASGALQVLRLVMVFALLSIAFVNMKHRQFLFGLSVLLSPLNTYQCQTSKFIARIYLTLQYAQYVLQNRKLITFQGLNNVEDVIPTIEVNQLDFSDIAQTFSVIDFMITACVVLAIALCIFVM